MKMTLFLPHIAEKDVLALIARLNCKKKLKLVAVLNVNASTVKPKKFIVNNKMVAKVYPDDRVKQIERSRRRIQELEIAIDDIRLQKGWVNWWLSLIPNIVYSMREEIKAEKNKIEGVIDDYVERKSEFKMFI